jgi:hypothetical protein
MPCFEVETRVVRDSDVSNPVCSVNLSIVANILKMSVLFISEYSGQETCEKDTTTAALSYTSGLCLVLDCQRDVKGRFRRSGSKPPKATGFKRVGTGHSASRREHCHPLWRIRTTSSSR